VTAPGVAPLQAGDPRSVGDFGLVGVLGAGGMGRVLLGVAPDGGRVAVKLVHAALADDDRFRARFRREVEIGRRVPDRWAAAVLAADLDASTPWLATPYIHGPTLQQTVATLGPLHPAVVTALAAGLARGLADLHGQGLVHRDLKPSNAILAADGPRLIDFGIATAIGATRMTSTNVAIGTPAYMSPEQASGEDPSPASDIFALGALLVMASTGAGPFGEGSALTVVRRVLAGRPDLGSTPEPLRAVVQACLDPDAGRRPTATALVEQFGPPPAEGWLPPQVTSLAPPVAEPATVAATLLDQDPGPAPRRLRVSRRAVLVGLGAAAATTGGVWWYSGPSVRWTVPVPPMAVRACAADGVVVLALEDSSLQGLDVATGRLLWSYPAADNTRGRLLATQGTVVSESLGLDLRTGVSRWKLEYGTPMAASPSDWFVGPGLGDDAVEAWAPDTGATVWSHPIPELEKTNRYVTDVAIVGDAVYAVLGGLAIGIDTAAASRRWSFPIPARGGSSLPGVLADEQTVFVVDGPAVYALDAATGLPRWHNDRMKANVQVTYAADDATLYGVAPEATTYGGEHVVALDSFTGATRWIWKSTGAIPTPPVVAGDTVFVLGSNFGYGESDYTVHALSTGSGTRRWRRDFSDSDYRSRPIALQALPDGLLVATAQSVTVLDV